MRRIALIGVIALVAGCKKPVPPEMLQAYQGRSFFTCCNIHHETGEINDANYAVGTIIPAGTPVQVQSVTGSAVTFTAEGKTLTLTHSYGTEQESMQQYLDKVLVANDPKTKLATCSHSAQQAIREGRVEKGMTREQVLLSLGYPPTHRTASTSAPTWTYWYNHWMTYQVQFDDQGHVANVIGRPAPTQDQPVHADAAPAPKAPARAKKHK